jgi:hypothetical protein
MHQPSLFHCEPFTQRVAYQAPFQLSPALAEPRRLGRPRVSRNALLRAFIYRALRRMNSLTDLVQALHEMPARAEAVGFAPLCPLPPLERFSAFLRTTDNGLLQAVRLKLLKNLLAEKNLAGRSVALDSCPIPSPVRENNLKTAVRDRFNKERFPKAGPTAILGVLTSYVSPPSRKTVFWGYRNHIVVDTESELPLWERTEPAHRKDGPLAIPLLESLLAVLPLPVEAVCADCSYDSEAFLGFIIDHLHAQPVVAANPRHGSNPDFEVKSPAVLCPAQLEMFRRGKMTPKRTGITYQQYSCPLHYDRTMQQGFLVCPVAHPKFLKQKGCNYRLRQTPSVRSQIPYGSDTFRQMYRERTAVERVFSRLLAIAMQDLPTRNLNSARNLCTTVHITVLLVALTAHRSGHSGRLAFVRSFVPNFLEGTA